MKTEFAIVGGGVAGLAAAIRLLELGKKPLLIEAGSYPQHKICGEFLSPESLDLLKRWGVSPVPIFELKLRAQTNQLIYPFQKSGGSLSHIRLDPALLKFAKDLKLNILTETQVLNFQPSEKGPHLLQLSNGVNVEALNVIIATGRYPGSVKPKFPYIGFKAHFKSLPLKEGEMQMFSLPGAYLGISPIEEGKFNVACLAEGKEGQSIEAIIRETPSLQELLSQGTPLFEDWMKGPIPEFGIKKTPDWKRVYFIGDAAFTIPPASGEGLSLALFGGCLAGHFAVKGDSVGFKKIWAKKCSRQLFWAKLLHRLLLKPDLSSRAFPLIQKFPYLGKKMFELTRYDSFVKMD